MATGVSIAICKFPTDNVISIVCLAMRRVNLIARWSLYSFTPGFLGIAMKIYLTCSSNVSPLLYISFIISAYLSIPKWSKTLLIYIPISSSPVVWFLFLLCNSGFTLDFNAYVLPYFINCIFLLSLVYITSIFAVFFLFLYARIYLWIYFSEKKRISYGITERGLLNEE